jgi:hypothetical protein
MPSEQARQEHAANGGWRAGRLRSRARVPRYRVAVRPAPSSVHIGRVICWGPLSRSTEFAEQASAI